MKTPDFFNDVPLIMMRDPLAAVLGATDGGILNYTYADVVKLAGHSCPTVAGAYLMVQNGLKELYADEIPVRGEIKVLMRGTLGDGVVGVIANVASMITGATDVSGFHGLGGMFDRRGLLFYNAEITGEMALERVDTSVRATLSYDPSFILPSPKMGEVLPLIVSGRADENSRKLFATLWQDRVKRILIDNRDNPKLVQCVIQ